MRLVRGCLAEDSDRKKLQCVDDLTVAVKSKPQTRDDKPTAAALSAPVEPVKQSWTIMEEASKMDGSPTVYMSTFSDDKFVSSYGEMTRALLTLRCIERTTSLFVSGSWYLGGDRVPIMYRIDNEKPVAQQWSPSTDAKAVGLWNGATAIPFLKALFGKQTLLMRVTPWREGYREISFNVADIAEKVQPLRKACNW